MPVSELFPHPSNRWPEQQQCSLQDAIIRRCTVWAVRVFHLRSRSAVVACQIFLGILYRTLPYRGILYGEYCRGIEYPDLYAVSIPDILRTRGGLSEVPSSRKDNPDDAELRPPHHIRITGHLFPEPKHPIRRRLPPRQNLISPFTRDHRHTRTQRPLATFSPP